jgi:hypothetical protein
MTIGVLIAKRKFGRGVLITKGIRAFSIPMLPFLPGK